MSKINIITPVHVASGEKYMLAYVDNKGYGYSLETVLSCTNSKDLRSPQLLDLLSNSKNLSNSTIISKIPFNKALLTKDNSVNSNFSFYDDQVGLISKNVNSLGRLYIPGSTIKGYIMNVAWSYLFRHNNFVNNYMKNAFNKVINKHIQRFEELYKTMEIAISVESDAKDEAKEFKKEVKMMQDDAKKAIQEVITGTEQIQKVFGVRDVFFDDNCFDILDVERPHRTKDQSFPSEHVEVIKEDSTSKGDFFFFPNKDLSGKILNEMLENGVNKKPLTDIQKEATKSIYTNLMDFYNWFPKANKEFISEVLKYEKEFVLNFKNNNFSEDKKKILKDTYGYIENEILNNKNVMRIGKYTNYILKTVGASFDDYYKEKFKYLFSPMSSDMKKYKVKSNILTTSLIVEGDTVWPLGYVELEL